MSIDIRENPVRNVYSRMYLVIVFLLPLLFLATETLAEVEAGKEFQLAGVGMEWQVGALEDKSKNPEATEQSILTQVLLYLPNRVFDLLDIVRLRVRVGPGLAAGVRITEAADVYIGSYMSVFAGLPGPRGEPPKVPVPIGIESYSAVGVSYARAETEGEFAPNYSPSEVGISLHPLFLGIDVGIDPIEILDFIAGFVLVDFVGDDF